MPAVPLTSTPNSTALSLTLLQTPLNRLEDRLRTTAEKKPEEFVRGPSETAATLLRSGEVVEETADFIKVNEDL